ncbi:MAG: hypothetical protein ACHREM_03700 [Polyangiales bacterium]
MNATPHTARLGAKEHGALCAFSSIAATLAAMACAPSVDAQARSPRPFHTTATQSAIARPESFAAMRVRDDLLPLYSSLLSLPLRRLPLEPRIVRDPLGHLTFATLASQHFPESKSNTYDWMPIVRRVVEQRLVLAPDVQLVVLGGRDILRAELGSARIGYTPSAFNGSGLLTFDTRF